MKEDSLRVLWATDGSPSAHAAVPVLKSLVLPGASTLHVLTVSPTPMISGARPDPSFFKPSSREARKEALEAARSIARSEANLLGSLNVPSSFEGAYGQPIQQIIRQARRIQADLIVVGAKGQSAIEMMLMGSVSQGVLQYSDRPVLVARGADAPIRTVVAGVDGTSTALKAVEFLPRLRLSGHPLIVLAKCVYLMSSIQPGLYLRRTEDEVTEFNRQVRLRAESDLSKAVELLRGQQVQTLNEISAGEAGPELLLSAATHRADLVVMGSRRPSRARKYLVGTTAEYVARQAPCSVLVVR